MNIAYGDGQEPGADRVINVPLVTSALEKLGDRLVMRAHVALEHSKAGDWTACFFAMAFGSYGELNRVLARVGVEEYDVVRVFREAYGIQLVQEEVWAVIEAFDHCRPAFQALVEEWLELNYVAPARYYGKTRIERESRETAVSR